MLKKFFIYFLVLIVFFPTIFAHADFSDTQNTKYKEAIDYLVENKIVSGFEDGTFRPNQNITRAEMMKIILKPEMDTKFTDENLTTFKDCFDDVKDEWYSPYVCYGKEKNVVKGFEDNTFAPNNNVTFAESVKIALLGLGMEDQLPSIKTGDQWYEPFLNFVSSKYIFSRYELNPDKPINRGQLSEIVYKTILYKDGKLEVPTTLSVGCGKTAPVEDKNRIEVDGAIRDFIFVRPSNYDPNKQYPLVFAFHGRTNSNQDVRGYYKVEEASKGQAFFIYPSGRQPGGVWQDTGDKATNIRDFAFFDALLKFTQDNYCIDTSKVFAVGHSLGAWMTNMIACNRSSIVRAFASVGGGITPSTCSRPIPGLIMHNPKDNLYTFDNGERARDLYIENNQCSLETEPVEPIDLNCVRYKDCQGADLIWCPHTDDTDWRGGFYPHTWPDDAGKYIWDFLSKFE